MKKLFLAILLLTSCLSFAQDLHWETDLNTAKEIAKQQNKPIIMYFTGSDWCSPCKQLKADFLYSDEFLERADSLVLLMIDLPFREDIITPEQRKKNKAVNKKYNPTDSYPYMVGLNSNGKKVNDISAYSSLRDTSLHFNFLNYLTKFGTR